MFELKYKITDKDMASVNKSLMWQYFVPYIIVSLAGIGAGIAAIILRMRTEVLILGIILVVLGAILLACTIMLVVAPKNFVESAFIPDDELERTFKFDDNGISVSVNDGDPVNIPYGAILKIKDKKTHLLIYTNKETVLLVKDAVVTGGTLAALYSFVKERISGNATASQTANAAPTPVAEATEKAEAPVAQAEDEQAVTAEPEAEKAETEQAATTEPEAEKAETEQAATTEPEAEKPETEQAATTEPEAEKPATEQAAMTEPEAEKPETEQAAATEPEAEKPEPADDKPAAKKSASTKKSTTAKSTTAKSGSGATAKKSTTAKTGGDTAAKKSASSASAKKPASTSAAKKSSTASSMKKSGPKKA